MRKVKIKKPFIYYEDLKPWEFTVAVIYALATLGVIVTCYLGSGDTKQITIIMYGGLPQMFLYFFMYVSLRNFRSYLIWFGFGIGHLILYFIYKGDLELQMYRGNPSAGLVNTIPLLLLFQLLRYASRKIQRREFVAPAKGGGPDLIENKKVTFIDFAICMIYIGSWLGLTMCAVYFW
ncbi:hypothetical protein SAMN05216464_104217 [Mucilaginibacter pineti]|uniref:Uncharacterized protein n=1 Tax=Mucilaginibacter pineti TaxID=1391627 RepID=A0A1G7ARA1_9SPHI|nr:hypothetical protein [Mucilaginibacter pineti]SDE17220.1 hypothetical protein SAMN05216464_104217 [Mucilaginibacter pineti]